MDQFVMKFHSATNHISPYELDIQCSFGAASLLRADVLIWEFSEVDYENSSWHSELSWYPNLTNYWNSVILKSIILDIGGNMRQNLSVSNRGQITLPASIRKRLGIQSGGVVTLEEKDNVVVLRPAAVVEIETYSDEEVARWDKEDRLEPAERNALMKRLRKRSWFACFLMQTCSSQLHITLLERQRSSLTLVFKEIGRLCPAPTRLRKPAGTFQQNFRITCKGLKHWSLQL